MTGRKRIGFRGGMRKLRGQRSIYNSFHSGPQPLPQFAAVNWRARFWPVGGNWRKPLECLCQKDSQNAPDADVSPLHYVIIVKWTLPTLRNVF